MKQKMVTIKDIARQLRVSPSTISKALSDKKDISPAMKKKVQQLAGKLDYHPNSIAQSLVTKKTRTLGLVLPYLGNPTTIERIRGIQHICHKNGYILISSLSESDIEEEKRQITALISRRVDGIILTPAENDPRFIRLIKEAGVPFVLMGELVGGVDCDFVTGDDFEGGKLATKHLVGLGHRVIAYFGSLAQTYSDQNLLSGYQNTLKKNSLKFRKELITRGNNEKETLKRNLRKVMELSAPPTAIIAWSDIMAINILSLLKTMHLKVPEDVSLVGYDNIDFLSLFHIPLTTISVPNYQMGNKAASLLLERIEKNRKVPFQKIVFAPKLVVRNSTATPRNKLKNVNRQLV